MPTPYQIIEVANTHGGDFQYLVDLINAFEKYQGGYGIKFQPFKFDSIATENYHWYPVYKDLFFSEEQWSDIIGKSNKSKDVWLDLFDSYGITILQQNLKSVFGIKLQSSVLFNQNIINDLSKLDLSAIQLVINISSYKVEEIRNILSKFSTLLNPKEILLEVGFQSYPTQLEDSGLAKISVLAQHFTNRIVFADHVSGETEDSIWLPIVTSFLGVGAIEKHVMLDREKTKYDHYSSLTPERYEQYIDTLTRYADLLNQPFINDNEKDYLKKSILIPILSNDKPSGSTLSLDTDFFYKRSANIGLNTQQIRAFIDDFYVLTKTLSSGTSILREHLKRANIAIVIACRLKSSRLPRKALLNIGKVTSVERCIKSALKFDNVNHVILATSNVEEDAELSNYTYSPSVIFHKGDPDDVIQRYLDITRALKIDVVVRVTADMPYIDNDVFQVLLKSHFENGADYTVGREAAVGTNLEIMNVTSLEKIQHHFKKANYSEYMTWYFQNNPDHFKLNFVDLPKSLVRSYRMTLDYQEDLDMFNKIEEHFESKNLVDFNLLDIFDYLDNNPSIANINNHLTLKYKTDQTLIDTLNRETKMTKGI